MAALEAGKHVLCEKPLGSNAADAEAMVAAAEAADRVLVEAYHWRYHPLADRIVEIVASGRLGELRRVTGTFTIPSGGIPRSDIRWDLALGGGALMDLGCYALQWCRLVAGDEPEVLSAEAVSPVAGVDSSMVAELRFSETVTGSIRCSMDDPERERVQTARLRALAEEAQLDPAFAEKWFNFVVAEVIQHHTRIAESAAQSDAE